MSAEGKPGEDSPRAVARSLGLTVPSMAITWGSLVDAACDAYWANRVPMKVICGTRSGFRHHQTSGTRPCAQCQAADAQERRERRLRAAGDEAGKGKPTSSPAPPVHNPVEKWGHIPPGGEAA